MPTIISRRFLLVAAFIFISTITRSQGAVIIEYIVEDSTTAASVGDPNGGLEIEPSSSTSTSVSADNLVAGTGVLSASASTGGNKANIWTWDGWSIDENQSAPVTQSATAAQAAIEDNQYFEWGFSVVDEIRVVMEKINLVIQRQSANSPVVVDLFLRVNTTAPISDYGDPLSTLFIPSNNSKEQPWEIDLTGVESLTVGESVIFTLTAYEVGNGGGGSPSLAIANPSSGGSGIVVSGMFKTVPEVSTALPLFLMASYALAVFRQTRRISPKEHRL